MAGNMWEWTTEHNIDNGHIYVVIRGGSFADDGATNYVALAYGWDESENFTFNDGFRVVLYIQ